MRILTRLGGICAVLAFFFPWLALPQADPEFPGFYSYTPFRLMGDPTGLPIQPPAALMLLLVPLGALVLIFTPLIHEPITRGSRLALVIGNALMLIPFTGFYMLAFGQRSYPSAPDIGFWATAFALLLTLSGLVWALYVSREQNARAAPRPLPRTPQEQRDAVLSAPASAQPAQNTVSQDG